MSEEIKIKGSNVILNNGMTLDSFAEMIGGNVEYLKSRNATELRMWGGDRVNIPLTGEYVPLNFEEYDCIENGKYGIHYENETETINGVDYPYTAIYLGTNMYRYTADMMFKLWNNKPDYLDIYVSVQAYVYNSHTGKPTDGMWVEYKGTQTIGEYMVASKGLYYDTKNYRCNIKTGLRNTRKIRFVAKYFASDDQPLPGGTALSIKPINAIVRGTSL